MRRVGFVMAGVIGLGCFLTTEPADQVDLEVTVTPAALDTGDTALVTVTLTNGAGRPIEFQAHGCPVYFAVFEEGGRQVAPSRLGCPLVPARIALTTGEVLRYEFEWLGEPWSNGRSAGQPFPQLLPPGRYTVRGVLALESSERFSAPVRVDLFPR
jgi:hypothetical protein